MNTKELIKKLMEPSLEPEFAKVLVEAVKRLETAEYMAEALKSILQTDEMLTAVHAADRCYEISKQALEEWNNDQR